MNAPPILSYAFRPLFLLGSLWAALIVPMWILAFSGVEILPAQLDIVAWHQHEMLFGFVAAAIGGFILTAIANWTGRAPVSGWPLALLVATWLAGRAVFLAGEMAGAWTVAVVDLLFLLSLIVVIARELIGGRNVRNTPLLLVIGLFGTGNLLFHLEQLRIAETQTLGIMLAVYMVAVLVSVIGGRVVPAFTRNWLGRQGVTKLPAEFGHLDRVAILLLIMFAGAALAGLESVATGVLGCLAGAFHLARLARWRGFATISEPLLWVLHIGYAWLGAGVLLVGLAMLIDPITASQALHVVMVGGFGTMILAMASRTSLGHTGRTLSAGRGTTACYLLITLAVLLRFVAPWSGEGELPLLWSSAAAWSAAYGLFFLLYLPVWIRPRVEQAALG